jgi:hypothetical protein
MRARRGLLHFGIRNVTRGGFIDRIVHGGHFIEERAWRRRGDHTTISTISNVGQVLTLTLTLTVIDTDFVLQDPHKLAPWRPIEVHAH